MKENKIEVKHTPHLASTNLVNAQDRTQDERENLALLIALQELVSNVTKGAESQELRGVEEKDVDHQDLGYILAMMARTIGELQIKLAQLGIDRFNMGNEIAKLNIEVAQKSLETVREKIEEIQKKQAEAEKWSTIVKVVGGIVTGIVVIVALASQQYILAALAIATYAATVSGGMDKLTGENGVLTNALQDVGLSKEDAMLLAGAIVVIATMLLSAGVAGGTTAILNAAAARSATVAANTAARGVSVGGQALKMALVGGMQALSSSGFINNAAVKAAKAAAEGDADEEQKWQIALTVVFSAVAMALSLGVGASLVNSGMSGGSAFTRWMSSDALTKFIKMGVVGQGIGSVAMGGGQMGIGVVQKDQGEIEKEIGVQQAWQELAYANLGINNKERKADMDQLMKMLKSIAEALKDGEAAWMKGQQEVAKVLAGR